MTRLLKVLAETLDGLRIDSNAPPRLLVAFSGGPDSTALLWGLTRECGSHVARVTAAHLDHGLDDGSAQRAIHAAEIAARFGVPCHVERRDVKRLRRPGESVEEAARRVRYEFLRQTADRERSHWILTAHHRDDQVETVLLRLLFGSGWQGLAAIAPQQSRLLRPLLDLPARTLRDALVTSGVEPNSDPTNEDLRHPRNRIRHHVLPRLEAELPQLRNRVAALARRTRRVRDRLDAQFTTHLQIEPTPRGVSCRYSRLRALPDEVRSVALSSMARRCRPGLLLSGASLTELERQISDGAALRVDCGRGWCWRLRGTRLHLERSREQIGDFQYTVRVPGELEIPEVGLRMRVRHAPPERWMRQGERWRTGLGLPLRPGERLTIRNRRAGDRLRPLGAPGHRRLKDVLIDRKMPREERDLLPLLLWRDRIAWVPGVTIDEAFRLTAGGPLWVAELEPIGISPVTNLLHQQANS